MLRRKAYDTLVEWKRGSEGRSALLLEGARRVGKTTLAEEFGRREYETCMVIDFTGVSSDVRGLFRDSMRDLDSLFLRLQAEYGVRLHRRRSLVVFDEVQAFPLARQAIKHLVADGRYDYMETGSLISLRQNVEGILIPSEEHAVRLDPLDFDEFLWALGEEPLAQFIAQCRDSLKPLPDSLHRKATTLFRQYMLVGGMPQAVETFTESKDLDRVEVVKRDILDLYRNDIARFAHASAARVRAAFNAIPAQLSKKNKRFVFSRLGDDLRSDDVESAFDWLDEAHIVDRCYRCANPSLDLASTMDPASYKCYLADTGLLVSLAFPRASIADGGVMASVLAGRLTINEGMLTENLVAQSLRASGHDLYYWASYDERSKRSFEVDFLLPQGYGRSGRPRIAPIEVKSSKRYGTSSLDELQARLKGEGRLGRAVVLAPRQLDAGDGTGPVTLPLYMAGKL